MHAKLKDLICPDIDDLENWSPGDAPFGIYIFAMIGPSDSEGEESFQICVCTPEWFANEWLKRADIHSGLHTLFVSKYRYRSLWNFIERAAQRSEGANWSEIGAKLAWLGHWEFADYSP